MKYGIVDDFRKYRTQTLLSSIQPTNEEKRRIFKVLKYLAKHLSPRNKDFNNLIVKASEETNDDLEGYNKLKENIEGCYTNECLVICAATNFGLYPKSLLMDTIAIHSRIKAMDSKEAWFDNFSLNSFLLQLTTVVYDKYDNNNDDFVKSVPTPSVLTGGNEINDKRMKIYNFIYKDIDEEIKVIDNILDDMMEGGNNDINFVNESVKLSNPKALLFHLGNQYRIFIEFNKVFEDIKTDEEALNMLDILNKKYPYYTGCTHGCDVFTPSFRNKSVSIYDIKEFTDRYPMSIVGYILNTKTYRSGRGQHWVALMFKNKKCYMICSQGNDFNVFEEKTLLEDINKAGFTKYYNPTVIQIDSCNCGLFSVLSNLCFLINGNGTKEPNISEIINMIGRNAANINEEGIFKLKKILAGY